MGIFDGFKKNKGLKIDLELTEDVGIVTMYKGKPLTGIGYKTYNNGIISKEIEFKDGLKNGTHKEFHENGQLSYETNNIEDEIVGELKKWYDNGQLKEKTNFVNGKENGISFSYHENGQLHMKMNLKDDKYHGLFESYFDNGNLEEKGEYINDIQCGIWKFYDKDGNLEKEEDFKNGTVSYNDITEKNEVAYYNGEKYSGIIKFMGNAESEYKDGIKIGFKTYFVDGTVKTVGELIDGKVVETKGWIKVDKNGEYDENGEKILVRQFKDGKNIEYFKNGMINSISDSKSGEFKRYLENGQLFIHKITDPKTYNETFFERYFENGEIEMEYIFDDSYGKMTKWYYQNRNTKKITINGFDFEFDENGNEISKRYEWQLEKELELRKYLNLKKFEGEIIPDDSYREILVHEIMTKGIFMFEDKDGIDIKVFGQRHTLVSVTQTWDEELEEWEETNREEIDDFHLTEYEDGYRFDEDDICKYFEIEDWPEWDFNGFSTDWCGIEEEDSFDDRQKKWNEYKDKFPLINSKDQFSLM